MPILSGQAAASPQRGFPVEDKNQASGRVTLTGESVQFFYNNAGERTQDAGQAAGTAVEAVLVYRPVMGSSGAMQATPNNTSLSFTSTAFTTEVPFPGDQAEGYDTVSWANRLAAITSGMTNGQYCVDYSKGIIYGVKASSQTSLSAATYKILGRSTDGCGSANTPSILTSAGTAIAANVTRRGFQIQNLGTNPLFVLFGSGASATVFHQVLKGGTGTDDGTGGSVSMFDGVVYTGVITVAGTSPRFTTLEL